MGKLKEIKINCLSLEEIDEYLYTKQYREEPLDVQNEGSDN
jgi:hypothetical protein